MQIDLSLSLSLALVTCTYVCPTAAAAAMGLVGYRDEAGPLVLGSLDSRLSLRTRDAQNRLQGKAHGENVDTTKSIREMGRGKKRNMGART